jgi:hypothetical protein
MVLGCRPCSRPRPPAPPCCSRLPALAADSSSKQSNTACNSSGHSKRFDTTGPVAAKCCREVGPHHSLPEASCSDAPCHRLQRMRANRARELRCCSAGDFKPCARAGSTQGGLLAAIAGSSACRPNATQSTDAVSTCVCAACNSCSLQPAVNNQNLRLQPGP